ncbi:MAG: hypothetical protein VX152_00445 [Pseudomonadota bacterium]|nr:hypothetical protein [Pseudomonadota bacterium]
MTIPKHLLLLVAATVSTFFAVSAQAQIWDEGDESVIRVGEEVFAAGDTLNLSGNSGLTWAAGNTVVVEEPSGGIVAAGNAVKVLEGAAGPVIVAGSDVSVAGAVSGSIYAAGQGVELDVDHQGGTVIVAGSNIGFMGQTTGSAYFAGESVRVEGRIDGDLYVSAGSVSLADDLVVGGEIVYDIGEREQLTLPEGLRGRQADPGEVMGEIQDSMINDGGTGGDIGFLIFSLIVGAAVILLMSRQADHGALWLRRRPWLTIGTGFAGLSSWVGLTLTSLLVVLLLSYGLTWFLMVLLVLVPVTMLAGFVAAIFGYFHGLHAVGALGARLLPESLNPTLRRLLAVSAAVVVLFLVGILLPGLSMLLSFLALGLGFGALGLRLWKGLPPVPAAPEVEAEAGVA